MKKSFILLALVAYFVIGAYSVTRTKSSALTAAKAQSTENAATPAIDFKLITNQQEVMIKFYHDAFGTDWQANESGYQGQVLNATVQLIATKNKKLRRVTMPLRTADFANDFDGLIERILDAGGNLQARSSGKAKSYSVNDPDGNLIVLTQRNP